MFCIGQLELFGVFVEFIVMVGVWICCVVQVVSEVVGICYVVFNGYVNVYVSYVIICEEYVVQEYEGGLIFYGFWIQVVYQQLFVDMVVVLCECLLVEILVIVLDLFCCQMNFQIGVVVDDFYIGKFFGDVL